MYCKMPNSTTADDVRPFVTRAMQLNWNDLRGATLRPRAFQFSQFDTFLS